MKSLHSFAQAAVLATAVLLLLTGCAQSPQPALSGSTADTGNQSAIKGASPAPSPTPAPSPSPITSGLPVPPAGARTYSLVEEMGGWQSCGSNSCAGGSGNSNYWQALDQSTPSRDGRSMQVYNEGVWANALWWLKLGANNNATHLLWDFYVQVDSASWTAAQAIEFDAFQFVGGYVYMMGTQCNYAYGAWDFWDAYNQKWVTSHISCPKFETGAWHHIQLYIERISGSHSYRFVTVAVNGVSYPVGLTYDANYVGWGDNLGVQYQLDVNASGLGYSVWVDQSTLTLW